MPVLVNEQTATFVLFLNSNIDHPGNGALSLLCSRNPDQVWHMHLCGLMGSSDQAGAGVTNFK